MFDEGSTKKNFFNRFTEWMPWGLRQLLNDPLGLHPVGTYGGVYLLARFEQCPSGPANHRSPAIFYVGESGYLATRWYQHERSFAGIGADTCVAAFPVWFGDDDLVSEEPWTTRYRLYVERRILWELEDRKLTNRK